MNRSRRFISTVFAFALFAATTARIDAQVFTKNQLLKGGASPVTIPVNYDNGTSLATAAPVGSPVHIVYGIQVTSNNTNLTSHVMVTITPPPGFASNAVRCIRFPLGGTPGTPVTSGCPLPVLNSSATFDVAPLSGADDKEIIVIDGVFTQAGYLRREARPDRRADDAEHARQNIRAAGRPLGDERSEAEGQ